MMIIVGSYNSNSIYRNDDDVDGKDSKIYIQIKNGIFNLGISLWATLTIKREIKSVYNLYLCKWNLQTSYFHKYNPKCIKKNTNKLYLKSELFAKNEKKMLDLLTMHCTVSHEDVLHLKGSFSILGQ